METDIDRLTRAHEISISKQHSNGKEDTTRNAMDVSEEQTQRKENLIAVDGDLPGKIDNNAEADSDEDPEPSGGVPLNSDRKIAVILKIQLGSSQYATMALRELMKAGGVKTYKPDFGGGR